MFTLRSTAFNSGGIIPDRYVEDSLVSPPLQWENPPAGTVGFALVMLDPDIPVQFRANLKRDFIHWLVGIPASVSNLSEGASPGNMPEGCIEFKTDFVTISAPGYGNHYGGPWPPDAEHRYVFLLHALKSDPNFSDSADFGEIAQWILYNTIDVATLTGVYGPAKKQMS